MTTKPNSHTSTIGDRRSLDPDHGGLEPSAETSPPAAGRRAWIVVGVTLAVASLAWGTYRTLDLLAHEESIETSSYASEAVTRLEVHSDNGSVTVVPARGDTVEVRTELSEGLRAPDTTERLVAGVLELSGGCPEPGSVWCSVDYVVEIPADRAVQIDAENGTVVVRGLSGDVHVDNDNGRIELDELSGNITVSNDNGRIVGTAISAPVVEATNENGAILLTFLSPPDSVTARNSNGRIEVEVPDDEVAYDVEMRSNNGDVVNEVRTDRSSDHTIDVSTSNGDIDIRPTP